VDKEGRHCGKVRDLTSPIGNQNTFRYYPPNVRSFNDNVNRVYDDSYRYLYDRTFPSVVGSNESGFPDRRRVNPRPRLKVDDLFWCVYA
jgi:hypothetical protein